MLLQCAVYCGVPAANSAFHVFQRVLDGANEDAGRDRRRGAGGPDAGAHARARRDRVGRAREPHARVLERRIRAGVLEQGTVDLLRELGVAERMDREGIVHHGIHLQFDGERHHVPLSELADGRTIVIYGQTEVVKDLIAARLASGLPLLFECGGRERRPASAAIIRFTHEARRARVRRDRRLRRLPRRLPRRRSRPACCARSSASTRSAGSASSRGWRRRSTSSSTRTTSAASRCSRCARRSSRATTSSVGAGRGRRRVAGRADLGGAADSRTALDGLDAARGADPREGRDGDAQLRRRADAVRPALPRRRRGAHRPADGGEGPEPRDRRRARARGGGSSVRDGARADATRSAACAVSGVRSTSRAG